jgi:hypothetical protein
MLSIADDITPTSSSQSKEIHINHSTPTTSNPSEGSTKAVVDMMRAKDGYTRQCRNKHCKQNIVRVLLDCGSNGNLIFVNKDKPMLLPYSKRLVPQSWNTSNEIFLTQCRAQVELNFFEYSDTQGPKWRNSQRDSDQNCARIQDVLAIIVRQEFLF